MSKKTIAQLKSGIRFGTTNGSKSNNNLSFQEHNDIFAPYRGKITKDDGFVQTAMLTINPKNFELARRASEDRKNFLQKLKERNAQANIMKNIIIKQRRKLKNAKESAKSKKKKNPKIKTYNEIKRLKRKKAKKEQKKKQKELKFNIFSENTFASKIIPSFEPYNNSTQNWENFLSEKIEKTFPIYSININSLTKNVESYMHNFKIEKIDISQKENLINNIYHFNGDVIKTEQKKKVEIKAKKPTTDKGDVEDFDKIKKDKEFIKMQQELLEELNKKEQGLEKSKISTDEFLAKLQEDMKNIKKKNYRNIEDNKAIIEEESKINEMLLTPEENEKIKERVINFTLKSFDKFSLENVLKYWIEHRQELKSKIMLNPNYRSVTEKKDIEEKERKKHQKAVNVKHIYTSPNEEIKKIIPFCSKKYTIQKKDA